MQNIVNVIQASQHLSVLRCATLAISNLLRGKPAPSECYAMEALPILNRLIFSTDMNKCSLMQHKWALTYVTDGSNDKIQAVIDSGCLKRVIMLLSHESSSVVVPAVRIVGNVQSRMVASPEITLHIIFIQNHPYFTTLLKPSYIFVV
ncbi:hypothetical protein C9374_006528 [Naegleria lovaniensis]|uniref:Uncharacterized protein n=1 Tax=Naegleria lovaniensis TaxID=51637 RepID=A0AA88GIE4_NAELO|nr:uncharacterized protein C9374_006528 [Naegleria lovaniensis]KAG2381539.1 hypothetical protein C9374_006528 [Naegleria lovaniensis]